MKVKSFICLLGLATVSTSAMAGEPRHEVPGPDMINRLRNNQLLGKLSREDKAKILNRLKFLEGKLSHVEHMPSNYYIDENGDVRLPRKREVRLHSDETQTWISMYSCSLSGAGASQTDFEIFSVVSSHGKSQTVVLGKVNGKAVNEFGTVSSGILSSPSISVSVDRSKSLPKSASAMGGILSYRGKQFNNLQATKFFDLQNGKGDDYSAKAIVPGGNSAMGLVCNESVDALYAVDDEKVEGVKGIAAKPKTKAKTAASKGRSLPVVDVVASKKDCEKNKVIDQKAAQLLSLMSMMKRKMDDFGEETHAVRKSPYAKFFKKKGGEMERGELRKAFIERMELEDAIDGHGKGDKAMLMLRRHMVASFEEEFDAETEGSVEDKMKLLNKAFEMNARAGMTVVKGMSDSRIAEEVEHVRYSDVYDKYVEECKGAKRPAFSEKAFNTIKHVIDRSREIEESRINAFEQLTQDPSREKSDSVNVVPPGPTPFPENK